MIMPGFRPLIGRRYFLASTVVGTIAAFIPVNAAHGATLPPSSPGPETAAPTPTAVPTSSVVGDGPIIGAAASFQPVDDPSVRPFHYHASDAELADLKRRIAATKWPDRETVSDASQGVNLATMRKLADYWEKHHNWRRAEAQLNRYPQFVT